MLLAAGAAVAQSSSGGSIEGTVKAVPEKYLAETVVFLKKAPSLQTPKTAHVDQKGLRFIPHVVAIGVGDSVDFLNSDAVLHDVYSVNNGGFNLVAGPSGSKRVHLFTKPGLYKVLCHLHPEMLAYLFVGESRFVSVVDAKGRYAISEVPPGTYDVSVWNSQLKAAPQAVTVSEGAPTKADFSLQR